MVKLYEEFVEFDKLHNIIKQLENRIKYWFTEKGTLGKDTSLSEISSTLTNSYSTRTIKVDFSDMNFMYQILFTVSSKKSEKCSITFKRYDLTEQSLIDTINDEIDINDVKEDYIISLISQFDDNKENPDDNKIIDNSDKDDTKSDDNEGDSEDDNLNLGGGFDEEEIQDDSDF